MEYAVTSEFLWSVGLKLERPVPWSAEVSSLPPHFAKGVGAVGLVEDSLILDEGRHG